MSLQLCWSLLQCQLYVTTEAERLQDYAEGDAVYG